MGMHVKPALVLGLTIGLGILGAGALLSNAALTFKSFERVVSVKGLSEVEVPADTAVWSIRLTLADNDFDALYQQLDSQKAAVANFLRSEGFTPEEISAAPPIINDRLADRYSSQPASIRYTALQVITVYSNQVEAVRRAQSAIADLGKRGIVFGGDEYTAPVQYSFTKLNDLKPGMIEQSTRAAREAAEKFAEDSNSRIGKLKTARQGQISIEDRDSNTPHIKRVRVVSTVDYYLAD